MVAQVAGHPVAIQLTPVVSVTTAMSAAQVARAAAVLQAAGQLIRVHLPAAVAAVVALMLVNYGRVRVLAAEFPLRTRKDF
jgi:hypothetical protein